MCNIAIIGCGYWGPNLIRNFHSINEIKVKTVCDRDSKRLKHMKDLYPSIEITEDIEQVINDDSISGVAIATPVFSHHKIAMMCLKAGKHAFIEKPMASSTEECNDLIEIAEKNNLVLMVGHVFLYSPPVLKIKELIDTEEIGEIFYISMQRLNLGLFQKDINVAWDLAPHDISIALYLLGERPVSVNCQGKAHINKKVEDITNISLNFESGRFATIQSSWIDPRKIREITIVGSKKMVVYDDTEPLEKIKVYDKRVSIPPHYDTFAEFQYSYHYGDIHIPYIKQTEPLKVECQNFIDSIKNKTKPLADGYKGREVVQILEASSKSLKNGGMEIKI
jgi:predicted dehydrogenase